jgi:hypothetical protein
MVKREMMELIIPGALVAAAVTKLAIQGIQGIQPL